MHYVKLFNNNQINSLKIGDILAEYPIDGDSVSFSPIKETGDAIRWEIVADESNILALKKPTNDADGKFDPGPIFKDKSLLVGNEMGYWWKEVTFHKIDEISMFNDLSIDDVVYFRLVDSSNIMEYVPFLIVSEIGDYSKQMRQVGKYAGISFIPDSSVTFSDIVNAEWYIAS